MLAMAGAALARNPPAPEAPLSRQEVQAILASSRKIVTPGGIEETLPVPINGSTQWLSIRGRDRGNPILLFLHGGPGSPTMPAAYTFQSPWEDYFTVVQWDQRGTGKTFAANDPAALAGTMTFEQMLKDGEEVVRFLQHRYDKRKIFLLGHSFGSMLGLNLADRHPEWFHAYLGVGQVVNTIRSEAESYRFALGEARRFGNAKAIHELTALAPYPGTLSLARIDGEHKWVSFYGGLAYGRTDFSFDANAWSLSPDYSTRELDAIGKGSRYTFDHLIGTLVSADYEAMTRFQCPIFLFEGRHDETTAESVATEWFARVEAPAKGLVVFENSAHMVMQEEPGRFLYHLVTDLRPLAVKAGDGR
jgi:pimeloyl-ACP methyl ester carboxylesterase